MCAYTCTYTHKHARTCTHAHTHTHMHTYQLINPSIHQSLIDQPINRLINQSSLSNQLINQSINFLLFSPVGLSVPMGTSHCTSSAVQDRTAGHHWCTRRVHVCGFISREGGVSLKWLPLLTAQCPGGGLGTQSIR